MLQHKPKGRSMKFQVEGIRTRTIIITEEISGMVNITKKEVMRVTDCPAVEDGDSTAWYGSVDQALAFGAKHTTTETDVTVTNIQESSVWDEGAEVDWV
tara:strand:+ start:826 stop:1122 length:297 start_codon:yes stop_codon:yes gene_type:complete